MTLQRQARPGAWRHGGRAAGTASVASTRHNDSSRNDREVCILIRKRNKLCNVNKLVYARPLGELVLASVYRNRSEVTHVSIPPSVLAFARKAGCRRWLVRFDKQAKCFSLDLAQVEKLAYLKRSCEQAEYFVDLARFQPNGWQDWNYIEHCIVLEDEQHENSKQLALL